MTTSAAVAARRRRPLPTLAWRAGLAVLVAALVLLVVLHQPSGAATGGHPHGTVHGAVHAPHGHGGGHQHAPTVDPAVVPASFLGAAPGHEGPAGEHDHETLVACTLLAALMLLALRRLRPDTAGASVLRAPAPSRVWGVPLRPARPPGAPDLIALGISRT